MMKIVFRVLSAILLLAVMVVIFIFGSQPRKQSYNASDNVAQKVYERIPEEYKPETETMQKTEQFHLKTYIREYAHFLMFAALGVSAFLFLLTFDKLKFYLKPIIATVFCVLYALSDEIHQIFVEGRGCTITDLWLDTQGILCSVALMTVITLMIIRIKERIGR